MKTETIFLGRNNTVDLRLKWKDPETGVWEYKDLSNATRITAVFGEVAVTSTDPSGGSIRWQGADFQQGEIRIVAGDQAIPPDMYEVPIIVYDNVYDDGIHWRYAPVNVVRDELPS